jgi:hypothetical protein
VAVMELLAVLSAAGVRRSMIHVAGQLGVLGGNALAPHVVDRALARLARESLLTFSIDGSAVTVHRLVMRLIREQAAARSALERICASAGRLLYGQAGSLTRSWHEDRAAVRDLVEQITALYSALAACRNDAEFVLLLFDLRGWAVALLNMLALRLGRRRPLAGHLACRSRCLSHRSRTLIASTPSETGVFSHCVLAA